MEETKLSKKEIEVLELIAQGLTTQQISKWLVLSESTINNRLQNVYLKLNIEGQNKKLKAVLWYINKFGVR